jgi:hypothetical protein
MPVCCSSPTNSNTLHQTLVDSIGELAASQKPDASQVRLTEEKIKAQIRQNCDDVMKRLLDTKRQLETETNYGVRKLLGKYEKKLTEELNFSSDSDDDTRDSNN